MLALIAAFSEVSGEAAYEVSMMHLGATGREGIFTVWLLHTHTAQYCFVSIIFSYTIISCCASLIMTPATFAATRDQHAWEMRETSFELLRSGGTTTLVGLHLHTAVSHGRCDIHKTHATGFTIASPTEHQITIEQPQTVIRYRAG